ncbi:MAG: hypothetical protein ACFFBL_04495 [Promethearchaeota archaeon]
MENRSPSWMDVPIVKLSLMILAIVLFNFGLFFILNFLAPIVTGIIVGFLTTRIRDGMVVGFLGTVLSYCIIFVISEWFLGFTTPAIDVAVAVLIMGLLGAGGGLMGAFLSMRMRS